MSRSSFGMNLESIVWPNVNGLLDQRRRYISRSSSNDDIPTHKHLVRKPTLHHLAKLAKRLSSVVITYLYSSFDGVLLSYNVRVSE